ncbi:uncharacterized protein LOC134223876 [Armigeres subalbatus]|uniref:uncharacterized protein LOC134223876 n=1 Tax=Armigeres subalbatus TaxID=124917 RepID=UPI002ED099AB
MRWRFLTEIQLALAVLSTAQTSGASEICGTVPSYAFFESTDDCSAFIFCNEGEEVIYQCHDDEIWSQVNGACVLGNAETCEPWTAEIECVNKTEGQLVAYPRDCGRFILCGANEAIVQECERGMIFDELESKCVIGRLDGCELLAFPCDGNEDDGWKHPDHCDIGIRCSENNTILEPCPEGYIFREDFQICFPGDVPTCEALPLEEMCVNRTNQILVHPDRCQSFVQCNNDESIEQDCPRGRIFHARNVTCIVGSISSDGTCESLDQICTNSTSGDVFQHSEDTCDIYIQCLDSATPQINFCASGRIWSQRWLMCIPGTQNDCQPSSLETMCYNQPIWARFPHPTDCTKIVSCNVVDYTEISCPVGYIVEPGTLDCILGVQENPETCISLADSCTTNPNAVLPFPGECERYIQCQNGSPSLMFCSPGGIFVEDLGRCAPGEIEECSLLPCNDQIAQHPNYCHIFVTCNNDQVSAALCPYQHIFHQHMLRCTPGDESTCEYDPLETMCVGRFTNSIYPYPSEELRCDVSIRCNNGESELQFCPAGMVHKRETLECVLGDDTTCDVFDWSCAENDPWRRTHPTDCNVIAICEGGNIVTDTCDPGQMFDDDLLNCIPGSCEPTDPLDTICDGQIDGVLVPHWDSENCADYYECQNEDPVGRSCTEGHIFHSVDRICIPGTVSYCEDLRGHCVGVPNGNQIFPDPVKCNLYLECMDGITTVGTCDAGYIFQETFGVCVPGDVDSCQVTVDSLCAGMPDGTQLPHPDTSNCEEYIVCVDELSTTARCLNGEIFHRTENICISGIPQASDGSQCIDLRDRCIGRADGNYALLERCDLYIVCTSAQTTVQSCPDGQIFPDDAVGNCVSGNVDTCEVSV